MSKLVIVTVNYCCAGAIVERLDALFACMQEVESDYFIVDNKSPDDSVAVLREALKSRPSAHLVEAPKNGGFGYGNNQIINKVIAGEIEARYVYLLNPDALPERGAIGAMVDYLDRNQDVGILGSGLVDESGAHTSSMYRFPTLWSEIDQAAAFGPISALLKKHRIYHPQLPAPAPVDWVAGTSFMVRKEVLQRIGGFDEDFFLYWEEVELCHRARKAGFVTHGLPGAKALHVGGVSTGVDLQERRVPDYWHRSRNLYFHKTRYAGPVFFINVVVAAMLALHRCRQLVMRRKFDRPHFLRDHVRHTLIDLQRPFSARSSGQ